MILWLRNQFGFVTQATAIALLLTVARVIIAPALQNPQLAASTTVTHLIIGFSCFVVAWKTRLSPLASWLVSYFFLWITLIMINSVVLSAAYERSIVTLVVLLVIVPFPSAISATIGTILGRMLPKPARWRKNETPEQINGSSSFS